jgi:hypothetical protein
MRTSIKQLRETRQFFAENPAGVVRVHIPNDWPRDYTREQWARWFAKCLNNKINSHLPSYGKGRKWDSDYQIRLWRDSRRVRDILTIRLRVYQFETVEARSRFGHLLARYDDF